MSRRTRPAPMYPDHDWTESDFESVEMRLDEGPSRTLTDEERSQRAFERAYARFLRIPEVIAVDQVTALCWFLDKYPHFKVSP